MSAFTNDIAALPRTDARVLSPLRVFGWSVRREFWEYRWLMLSPLIGVGIMVLGFALLAARGIAQGSHLSVTDDERAQITAASAVVLHALFDVGLSVVLICALFAGMAYCIGALYNERRDRTILFWKSLPVSNAVTVLAKAFMPLVFLPVTIVVGGVLIQIVLGIGLSMFRFWSTIPVTGVLQGISPMRTGGLLLDHAALFSLSMAPIFGWFLAVSSAARRAPALWGFGVPFAACAIEYIAFGRSTIGAWIEACLARCFAGLGENAHMNVRTGDHHDVLHAGHVDVHLATLHAGSSASLWGGVIGAALCIVFAIWMRRRQEPV